MKKSIIIFLAISFCGGSTELVSNEEPTTTSTTTVPIELTWDNMYEVCTNEINLNNNEYFFTFFDSSDYFKPFDDYLRENQVEVIEFCENNFTYEPISPELYKYSAKWLEEIYSLKSWMTITSIMCEKYEEVCVNYNNTFDYSYLINSPAFQITDENKNYDCYIVETPRRQKIIENDRYTRLTQGYKPAYDNNMMPIPISERKRVNNILGNQYIRSSIIFPKPFDYRFEESQFSPEQLYTDIFSMTTQPPHFWNCVPASAQKNYTGQDLIKGYGPPFIRGEVDLNSENITAEGKWVMWSVITGGPESVVAEYEIVEFSWFNSTQGTLDYCRNYTLDADYLIAKDEESDRGIIPNLYGPELINMEFVTSDYCESRTKFFTEYP